MHISPPAHLHMQETLCITGHGVDGQSPSTSTAPYGAEEGEERRPQQVAPCFHKRSLSFSLSFLSFPFLCLPSVPLLVFCFQFKSNSERLIVENNDTERRRKKRSKKNLIYSILCRCIPFHRAPKPVTKRRRRRRRKKERKKRKEEKRREKKKRKEQQHQVCRKQREEEAACTARTLPTGARGGKGQHFLRSAEV